MWQYVIIPIVALFASGLTLFSGFGLGTILLPVFAVFFPVDVAVAMTATVHLLNNFFKLALLGKHADRGIVLRFGVPAIVAAYAGALLLIQLSNLPPVASYQLGKIHVITPVKLSISILMIVFALLEVVPRWKDLSFPRKYLPVGGLLSGFFGGLSGHQGALRSAFLARAELTKESFLASGIAIACIIDVTRLLVYTRHFAHSGIGTNLTLMGVTTIAAFAGAFIATRLLKKVTFHFIRIVIAILLFLLAILIASGLI